MQFSGIHIHDLSALPVPERLVVDEIVEKTLQKKRIRSYQIDNSEAFLF